MNSHLNAAFCILGEMDAVINAIDEIYMDDAESRHQSLVNILNRLAREMEEELEKVSKDSLVVDAIYAVNNAERKCSLKSEE